MDSLNRNELEALRILWDVGELKPPDVEAQFAWDIDNGTLRSVLKVLMNKGLVARRKSGKAYYYKAARSREGVLSRVARQMAHVFANGSTAGLIAELIKSEPLSPGELAELRRIARTGKKEPRRSKR